MLQPHPTPIPHRLQKELDLATHAHTLLQERIAGSESAQLQEAVTSLETNLVSAQEDAQAARTRRQELEAAAHTLEREMKDFAKDAAKHIKAAQGQLSAGKKGLEVAKREAKVGIMRGWVSEGVVCGDVYASMWRHEYDG